jgi:hypothetical protein
MLLYRPLPCIRDGILSRKHPFSPESTHNNALKPLSIGLKGSCPFRILSFSSLRGHPKPAISNNAGFCQALCERSNACTRRRAPFRSSGSDCHYHDQGSRVIFRSDSVRPNHLFDRNIDHDYYFELPVDRGAGRPINEAVIYCTPWPVSSCPACEPNFKSCW